MKLDWRLGLGRTTCARSIRSHRGNVMLSMPVCMTRKIFSILAEDPSFYLLHLIMCVSCSSFPPSDLVSSLLVCLACVVPVFISRTVSIYFMISHERP
jgi:hypothetical protein